MSKIMNYKFVGSFVLLIAFGLLVLRQVTDLNLLSFKTVSGQEAPEEVVAKIRADCSSEPGLCYESLTAWEEDDFGIDFSECADNDLVCANKIATAECYNDWPDGLTDRLYISGGETSKENYIKIYTPLSERHDGTWGNGFRLNRRMTIYEANVRIDGIAVHDDTTMCSTGIRLGTSDYKGEIYFSNNLVKGEPRDSDNPSRTGVYIYNSNVAKVWNNIIYDNNCSIYSSNSNCVTQALTPVTDPPTDRVPIPCDVDADCSGNYQLCISNTCHNKQSSIALYLNSVSSSYIYHNTIVDNRIGISTYYNTPNAYAKNNLVYTPDSQYYGWSSNTEIGTYDPSSTNNISAPQCDNSMPGYSTDYPGLNPMCGLDVIFADYDNDDFRLTADDISAR